MGRGDAPWDGAAGARGLLSCSRAILVGARRRALTLRQWPVRGMAQMGASSAWLGCAAAPDQFCRPRLCGRSPHLQHQLAAEVSALTDPLRLNGFAQREEADLGDTHGVARMELQDTRKMCPRSEE